jgi:DNA polymerase III subunit gamma/tau
MASQALYLKWRPVSFDEVVGQEHVTYTLRNALVSERVGHAYLFAGPRGCGKTTMARVLAKAVNCLAEDPLLRPCNECQNCIAVNEGRFLDLIEIDAASHTGVDDVRELRDRIAFSPNEGRYKIYIIDEVHRFSGAAFDALLKTIEEPPAHAIFILATTEIHKVPQTILSRCQRFEFRRIPLNEIMERLQALVDYEGSQAEAAALELVARQATGSLRDAISLLDQLLAEPGDVLTLSMAQAVLGTATSDSVRDLTSAIIAGDTGLGLELINAALDQGTDPRQFASQMVEYLRLVMLIQTGGAGLASASEGPEKLGYISDQAGQFPRTALIQAIRKFNRAATDASSGWQPQLPLELAFIESVDSLYAAPVMEASPVSAARPTPVQPTAAPSPVPRAAAQPDEPALEPPAANMPSLDEVAKKWRDVLRTARELDKPVEALLNSGKLYGIEGSSIVLQMPSELLRDKIEGEHNRQIVEKALQQIFGRPLSIRCRIGGGQQGDTSSQVDDLLTQDSLAAFAVNDLGGKVKRVKNSEEKSS